MYHNIYLVMLRWWWWWGWTIIRFEIMNVLSLDCIAVTTFISFVYLTFFLFLYLFTVYFLDQYISAWRHTFHRVVKVGRDPQRSSAYQFEETGQKHLFFVICWWWLSYCQQLHVVFPKSTLNRTKRCNIKNPNLPQQYILINWVRGWG